MVRTQPVTSKVGNADCMSHPMSLDFGLLGVGRACLEEVAVHVLSSILDSGQSG